MTIRQIRPVTLPTGYHQPMVQRPTPLFAGPRNQPLGCPLAEAVAAFACESGDAVTWVGGVDYHFFRGGGGALSELAHSIQNEEFADRVPARHAGFVGVVEVGED